MALRFDVRHAEEIPAGRELETIQQEPGGKLFAHRQVCSVWLIYGALITAWCAGVAPHGLAANYGETVSEYVMF